MGRFKFLGKPFAVAVLSCLLGAPAFAESIMVEDCGFESWNDETNLPAGPKNR